MFIQISAMHKSFPPAVSLINPNPNSHPLAFISKFSFPNSHHPNTIFSRRPPFRFAILGKSDSKADSEPSSDSDSKPKARNRRRKTDVEDENIDKTIPTTIPRKPRRGRKSEAAAVEDFVRDSLERTFATIRNQNSEVVDDKESGLKDRVDESSDSDRSDSDEEEEDDDDAAAAAADGGGEVGGKGKKMVVEEENDNWPIDADVGWGIRASEYFEQHSIKNIVGEDGVEIDWEGEIDDSWVKEINCLEWESFAFHPSPLIVLVFERYNRASKNWNVLKELEKAAKVYWSAKDRLPPRMVKIDINIERDLAYALKAKECPQILFLRGNKILYREKESRTADELIHMIAYFYYKAKKPSCVDDAALSQR